MDEDVRLADVLEYIAALHDVTIRLGETADGKPIEELWPPVTIVLPADTTWASATPQEILRDVAGLAGYVAKREGDGWVVFEEPR